eukprot:GDKJ01018644.1.p1 GENE.GDKJ01018644.1~~GDKJ01018644.1.p1  ORF type:complete len:414 (+),score=67.90 GDKJ01018644.1:164-1243(+)
MRKHYTTFVRRAKRGIPQQYRWEAWKTAACYKDKYIPGLYHDLCNIDNSFSSLIKIDTPRTFPEFRAFDRNCQDMLYRILNCFVNHQPTVGYCQGMNFIAGLLLIVSDFKEEETFWVFCCLMDFYGLEGFFRERFPLLRLYLTTFEKIASRCIPEIQKHFEAEGVAPAVYLHQWLLTMFINCLPFKTVVALWDFLMVRGLPGMLQITAALLYVLRAALLNLTFEEIVRFLKSMRANSNCNEVMIGKLLVRQAERVPIDAATERLLMEYDIDDLLFEAEQEEQRERDLLRNDVKNTQKQPQKSADTGNEKDDTTGGGLSWLFNNFLVRPERNEAVDNAIAQSFENMKVEEEATGAGHESD